jgi:dTDP-4-dehydrorhamnose 3,5-epimerase-like enzyme
MKKILKNNFKDSRGLITDIFINKPKDHCTLVTFNKNAVRGNHFHKKSTQYSFIVSGKVVYVSCKISKKGNIISRIKKDILNKNSLIIHKPYYAHAFKALKPTYLLAFVDGIRGGNNYEKDTFRLNKKLIK